MKKKNPQTASPDSVLSSKGTRRDFLKKVGKVTMLSMLPVLGSVFGTGCFCKESCTYCTGSCTGCTGNCTGCTYSCTGCTSCTSCTGCIGCITLR